MLGDIEYWKTVPVVLPALETHLPCFPWLSLVLLVLGQNLLLKKTKYIQYLFGNHIDWHQTLSDSSIEYHSVFGWASYDTLTQHTISPRRPRIFIERTRRRRAKRYTSVMTPSESSHILWRRLASDTWRATPATTSDIPVLWRYSVDKTDKTRHRSVAAAQDSCSMDDGNPPRWSSGHRAASTEGLCRQLRRFWFLQPPRLPPRTETLYSAPLETLNSHSLWQRRSCALVSFNIKIVNICNICLSVTGCPQLVRCGRG